LFLGATAEPQKATISFVISVSPSLSPHATTQFPLEGLPENLILSIFLIFVEKTQVSLKSS
jgi:hypothetical protein